MGDDPPARIPLGQLETADLPTEDDSLPTRSVYGPLGALLLPTIRGCFRLEEVLGRGSHGVVYRARDMELKEDIALKLLNRPPSAKNVERFRREGDIGTTLDHPGIVRVRSQGEVEGVRFIAYELLTDCERLSDIVKDLARRKRLQYIRDAALALGHAHANGIVHRDVKASNFLVDGEGRLRVADFGVAHLGGSRLTNRGRMVGTITHMAPEQISGERDQLGPHTDVWGLGVVLYRLLTDVYPFRAKNLVEITTKICEEDPTPPRELDATISEAVEAVCLRALRRSIEDRYPEGSAFAAGLDAAL
jgi:serine/threonine-protein kinase